jgi:hypothetical protein
VPVDLLQHASWSVGFAVYVAGVVAGLIVIDASPIGKIGLALLWPIGPLAFVVTVAILLAAAMIVYPLVTLGAALVVGACCALLTHC